MSKNKVVSSFPCQSSLGCVPLASEILVFEKRQAGALGGGSLRDPLHKAVI